MPRKSLTLAPRLVDLCVCSFEFGSRATVWIFRPCEAELLASFALVVPSACALELSLDGAGDIAPPWISGGKACCGVAAGVGLFL